MRKPVTLAAVGGFTRQELADRSGVDSDYVDRLVEIGILTPGEGETFSLGDVRRARLLKSLEEAGMPLDGMGRAVRSGHLSFAFLDHSQMDRFSGFSGKTFRELTAETGIPIELLQAVRESIGFALPNPDDPVRDDELGVLPAIKLHLSHAFPLVIVERWLRVYGESLRRIVETDVDWYRNHVMRPLLESGMGSGETMEASARFGAEAAPLMQQALTAIYHGQQEHAWMKNIIESVETSLDEAGVRSKLDRPPAMAFLDLTGYTRLTEERGDEAAAELAASLAQLVRRASGEHGGWPVKWLGDGVMFYFKDPGGGALAALEMVERVPAGGLPPARVGLDAGPVIFQDGDYFGRTVNNAARIAAYARSGEVLVSQAVLEAADVEGLSFTEIGPVELKGVSLPLRLHAARRDR
jgi:class 3 adenylate cyclase/DNA-binding transcriptional MerR regulator